MTLSEHIQNYSADSTDSNNSINSNISKLSASAIIIGTIYLLIGLTLIFFGKRLIRYCVSINGYMIYASSPLLNFILSTNPINLTLIAELIYFNLLGIMISAVYYYNIKIGIYVIGASFYANIWYIVDYFYDDIPNSLIITFIAILTILGGIITYYKMNIMVILSTSFLGSQFFIKGISILTSIKFFYNDKYSENYYYNDNLFWTIFIESLILWGLGAVFQFYKFKDFNYLNNETDKDTII